MSFVLELLNTPKFIQYIGDRGVRTPEQAVEFIETRFRKSYVDNGYGLYAVELKESGMPVGICGFVRRDTLPGPDLGFAFLPQHERKGYAYESATAMMNYAREQLAFGRVLAITSLDNNGSIALLEKLGFTFDKLIDSSGEQIKLFSIDL